MNRIYQGKVTNVQKLKPGAKGIYAEDWEDFAPDVKQAKAKWQSALWQHHQLFQDAVIPFYALAIGHGSSAIRQRRKR